MRLGFVIPWYGENIPGGAESALRGIVHHLVDDGVDAEVLTTCVKEFLADWNTDYHKPGVTVENGITVRRFPVRRRDRDAFDMVNLRLMRGRRLKPQDQAIFMREMINSDALYEYISTHSDEYDHYIYIPYMFGTTYFGIKACPEKAVVIPCFHEEAYIHMGILKEAFESARGMIFLAKPERELANKVFDIADMPQETIGVGVDNDITGDATRFREKYGIKDPFIVYAGRKDEGKNIYTLIRYFEEFKKRHKDSSTTDNQKPEVSVSAGESDTDRDISMLKLILIGGGSVEIPSEIKDDVIDLGFVDRQDKYDVCAAALCMCQPSIHESFSIVIMESWLCGRPVLVHNDCDVTRNFVQESGGGLYFKDYFEFEGCIEYMCEHPDITEAMGRCGKAYVDEHFAWDVVTRKYKEYFERLGDN